MRIKLTENVGGWKRGEVRTMSDASAQAHIDAGNAVPFDSVPAQAPEPASEPGQCKAKTKSGSRCKRKATAGGYCSTHS